MKRTELQPRRGADVREFLRYYVLVLLRKEHLSPQQIIRRIRKASAENRDFRPSGPLLVAREDLDGVVRQLNRQGLIRDLGAKWCIGGCGAVSGIGESRRTYQGSDLGCRGGIRRGRSQQGRYRCNNRAAFRET